MRQKEWVIHAIIISARTYKYETSKYEQQLIWINSSVCSNSLIMIEMIFNIAIISYKLRNYLRAIEADEVVFLNIVIASNRY